MQMHTFKAVTIGSFAGAATLIFLELSLGLMVRLITSSPTPLSPTALSWHPREAFLGALLGAITLQSVVLARSGNNRKAGRLCAVGGGLMALLILCQTGYVMYMITQPTASTTVRVEGPTNVPMHLRAALILLLSNVSLK